MMKVRNGGARGPIFKIESQSNKGLLQAQHEFVK